jgi:hypothetical protein
LLWILRTLFYAANFIYRIDSGSVLCWLGQRLAETPGEGAEESCVRSGLSSIGSGFPQKGAAAGNGGYNPYGGSCVQTCLGKGVREGSRADIAGILQKILTQARSGRAPDFCQAISPLCQTNFPLASGREGACRQTLAFRRKAGSSHRDKYHAPRSGRGSFAQQDAVCHAAAAARVV